MVDYLAGRLEDSDEDVRFVAVQTLGKLDAASLAQYAAAISRTLSRT